MKVLILLLLAVAATATCVSNDQCMGNGWCNAAKTRCKCKLFWIGPNCTTPYSARAETPIYGVFRWGGVTWFGIMTIVIGRCMWKIRQHKALKWICLSYRPLWDRGGGVDTDPQQLTLAFVFCHCFVCLIEYATDPGCVLNPANLFYMYSLQNLDLLFLMCSVFTMVRYWVKIRGHFSQITIRVLRVFDCVSFSLISGCICAAIFRASTFRATHPRALFIASIVSDFLFMFFILLYFLFVLGFALYYGIQLLRYLQTKRSTTQMSVRPLRKLTVLMFAMVFAVILGCAACIVLVLVGNNADENISIEAYIVIRSCIGIFLISVPFALGNVANEPVTTAVSQHGSKRSTNPTKSTMPKGFADDLGEGPKVSEMTVSDDNSPKASNVSEVKVSLPDVELSASAHPNVDGHSSS